MITVVSSTNRPDGLSAKISQRYLETLRSLGVEANYLGLESLPAGFLQHFSESEGSLSPDFAPIQALVNLTDTFIFVVPEYNGSFPGVLKLFIDGCAYPDSFKGKKAALVGFSGGMFGNLRGLDHLDAILCYLQVTTLPYRVHISRAWNLLDAEGEFDDAGSMSFINLQAEKLIAWR